MIKDYTKFNNNGVLYNGSLDDKYTHLYSNYILCLLRQNNKYYSLNKDFYKNSQFIPIEELNFEKYGFKIINTLFNKSIINNEKVIPIERLKILNDGKFDILIKELE